MHLAGEWRPHSLRHYFASGLIADGCDVVTVQRALGYKAPSITLDTYSHLWPSAEDRTRQASGRLAAAALVAAADRVRTEGDVDAADLG
jgi:integrase